MSIQRRSKWTFWVKFWQILLVNLRLETLRRRWGPKAGKHYLIFSRFCERLVIQHWEINVNLRAIINPLIPVSSIWEGQFYRESLGQLFKFFRKCRQSFDFRAKNLWIGGVNAISEPSLVWKEPFVNWRLLKRDSRSLKNIQVQHLILWKLRKKLSEFLKKRHHPSTLKNSREKVQFLFTNALET